MNFSFPYTYEIEPGQKIILTVDATYHRAERGTRTDPGFAAYIEVDSVTGSNGEIYIQKLCGQLWDRILDAASDQVPEKVEPEFQYERGYDPLNIMQYMFRTDELKMFTGFPCNHFVNDQP